MKYPFFINSVVPLGRIFSSLLFNTHTPRFLQTKPRHMNNIYVNDCVHCAIKVGVYFHTAHEQNK